MDTGHTTDPNDMFRPPVHRTASAILDRSLFTKIVPISAARISENKQISRWRDVLGKSRELLLVDRINTVRDDPDPSFASKGGKCLLLRPEVKAEDSSTWSSVLQGAVQEKHIGIIPFNLKLEYNYWSYLDIMQAVLPEDAQDEIPVGFSIVGHIAHLNLRDNYLPYKHLIAEVLMDKNSAVKTVINKTHLVGTDSEYRTFGYEVLKGEDNMNVEIREADCTFKFDYSKVYWNSRLGTEHHRLVSMFKPGEVVCDVMAGVGPFAIPAGKKGVFVWANDLNPDSYASMKEAITRNKVDKYVRPFCEDGNTFIHHAADDILNLAATGKNKITIPPKRPSRSAPHPAFRQPSTIITIPQTISHFVMNLPATAIEFLPSFSGLYAGHEKLFSPHTETLLPMVHVHCFSTKSDDNVREGIEIGKRISAMLGVQMTPGSGDMDGEVQVYDVRDVAPQKRMFCASFRLPAAVAFRSRQKSG